MSDTMRGVVFVGDGQVEVREFPKPTPEGTEVLVEMKASGLCGSDIHSYYDTPEQWAEAPIIRGHEPGGVVAEVGDDVTMVEIGDRVSVYHAPSCGHCEACARGEFFRCTTIGPGYRLASRKVHGADADYVLVDQNVCFPLPDELNFEDAAIIACAGGTSYHALRRADLHAAEYVVVSGLGPVGLCAVMLAKAMGGIVIGVDPVAYRRHLALEHGAAHVIDPTTTDMPEAVKEITGGGAEVGIETSGNDEARVALPKATPYHARVVYVGWGGDAKNATFGPMLGERWITGSNMFTEVDYYELVRLMLRRGMHLSDLVTHRFSLDEAQKAFDLFYSRETGKVLFVWD
jgi:threonine dehydrogenase-like Zn-dependent dehydrogenase